MRMPDDNPNAVSQDDDQVSQEVAETMASVTDLKEAETTNDVAESEAETRSINLTDDASGVLPLSED